MTAVYYGDRFSGKPGQIIPARRAYAWRDLVGPGSPLYTKSLKFNNATFERDSEAYLLFDGEMTGPFAANVPAISSIGGRQYIQLEESESTVNAYSEAMSSLFIPGGVTVSDNYTTDLLGNLTLDKICEDGADSTHEIYQGFAQTNGQQYIISFQVVGDERTQFDVTSGANPYFEVKFDLSDQSIINDSADWALLLPTKVPGLFIAVVAFTATATETRNKFIHLRKAGAQSYQGITGEGLSIGWFNMIEAHYLNSYIKAVAAPATREKDQCLWSEAQVAAESWIRDRFAIAVYPYYSSDQIAEDHKVFCLHDSVEDIYGYLDSSAQFNIDGSVSGSLLQTDPLVWNALDKIIFAIEADDGANCKAKIFGAQGGGNKTGVSFSTSNGTLEWGARNQSDQFGGLLSEPYRW